MKKPPPSEKEFNDKADEVQDKMGSSKGDFSNPRWGIDPIPIALPEYLLQLIYSGNGDLAWKFLDKVWSPIRPGRDAFTEDFKAQLKNSHYWPTLQKMNAWP